MPEANLFQLFCRRLNALGAPYMVSGSVAVIAYGEPRLTHDVDVVLDLDRARIEGVIALFPPEEFYCPPAEVLGVEIARARRGHFNLIHHASGFKADVYLAGTDPLHVWALARCRALELEGESLFIAPPEYVILRKLEYFSEGGSEKHLRDIRSMLEISGAEIDREALLRQISTRGLEAPWRRVAPDAE